MANPSVEEWFDRYIDLMQDRPILEHPDGFDYVQPLQPEPSEEQNSAVVSRAPEIAECWGVDLSKPVSGETGRDSLNNSLDGLCRLVHYLRHHPEFASPNPPSKLKRKVDKLTASTKKLRDVLGGVTPEELKLLELDPQHISAQLSSLEKHLRKQADNPLVRGRKKIQPIPSIVILHLAYKFSELTDQEPAGFWGNYFYKTGDPFSKGVAIVFEALGIEGSRELGAITARCRRLIGEKHGGLWGTQAPEFVVADDGEKILWQDILTTLGPLPPHK